MLLNCLWPSLDLFEFTVSQPSPPHSPLMAWIILKSPCPYLDAFDSPSLFLAWIILKSPCLRLDAFELSMTQLGSFSTISSSFSPHGLDAFDLRSLIYFFSYWRKNIQALCGLDAFQFLCHIRSRGVFVSYSSFWFCASNSFRCTIPSFVTKYACSGLLGLSTYRNLTYPLSIAGFR